MLAWLAKMVLIFLVYFGPFFAPVFSFAYDDKTTHPALTDEIVDLFNLYYPAVKISDSDKKLIVEGSIDEDEAPRWLNHFYDPVYNRGLWGNGSAKNWATDTFAQAIADPGYTGGSALASVTTGVFDSRTDYSWDRAIYDYVWRDKERGLKALGHILHLLEDMSVPDHTRNDPHPPVLDLGSPYEHWTKKFTQTNIEGLAKSIYADKPLNFGSLQEIFDSLATYSNNNFFSKDTILSKDYEKPVVDFYSNSFGFGASNSNAIVRQIKRFDGSTEYTLIDSNNQILSNYWTHLSRQAVLHGADAAKLFFKEAEKERQSKKLWAQNQTLINRMANAFRGFLGASRPNPTPFISEIPRDAFLNSRPTLNVGQAEISTVTSLPASNNENPTLGVGQEARQTPSVGQTLVDANSDSALSVPNQNSRSASDVDQNNSLPAFLRFGASLSSAGFGGGGSPTPPPKPQQNTIEAVPPPLPPPPPPDLTHPDISFAIKECDGSLASDSCLLNSASVTLEWSSIAEDLARFNLECLADNKQCLGFNFASTTATTTLYNLSLADTHYIFKAKAIDNSGNESSVVEKNAKFSQSPVVINEIAWAGTKANANDEWVELYNRTSNTVNLSSWVLRASDGVPYLNLSGSIAPFGYYLIERSNDDTVSDVAANLILPFSGVGSGSGLGNNGETLILSYGSTTIDQTPACGNNWSSCGGSSGGNRPTAERIDPDTFGTSTANWGTANGLVNNGKDSKGDALTATPQARNSLHYLVSKANTLASDKILKKFFGTYIIETNNKITIPTERTLTIEPGVTVKIGGLSSLVVEGDLISEGTAEEPINFVSLNNPPIYWKNIRISETSKNSSIKYTNFEYGGKYSNNTPTEERSLLSIIKNSTPVSHSVFGKSFRMGLILEYASSTIDSNIFSTGTSTANLALDVTGGAPAISKNTFSQNYQGLHFFAASEAVVGDNIFNNNVWFAAHTNNGPGDFYGNSGSGNGKDGILLSGDLARAFGTTTMRKNALPFVLDRVSAPEVPQGAGVVIEPGTVWQGESSDARIDVKGTLHINGSAKDDIVFSALNGSVGGWQGIKINSGSVLYGGGFTVKQAGNAACNMSDPNNSANPCAGIYVADGGKIDIANAIFENNYKAGMRIASSATSTLANVEFNNHTEPLSTSTGLTLLGANVVLNDVSFAGNKLGLASYNSTISAFNVTFTDNIATTSPSSLF